MPNLPQFPGDSRGSSIACATARQLIRSAHCQQLAVLCVSGQLMAMWH
jgi:hypothetical protein